MKLDRRSLVISLGAFIAIVVLAALLIATCQRADRDRLAFEEQRRAFKAQQANVCRRQMADIKTLVTIRQLTEVHARVQGHIEPGLIEFCLGTGVRINSSAADDCWVAKGETDTDARECYGKVLTELKQLYEQHEADWR